MPFLELDKKDTVAVLSMNNGKNTQDLVFAQTMNSLLEEVNKDTDVTALVITSTDEKNWSQGIDLEWMNQENQKNNKKDVREFFVVLDQVYSKLMLLPVPTIAAITGHAFGAGAFLATACDYRFMNAHRGYFCFPEIDLKMDFLPGVFSMMAHKLPGFKLPDLVYTGKHAGAKELEKYFIVETACANIEETIKSAMDFAKNFNKDRELIGIYKQKFNGKAADIMVQEDLEHFKTN
ncbi:MAG: enoyl-CoA hydratase/isomerase family protein [Deltaproteobacteria bacterium]|nr:enoyl-CoA hydratase/isomerase family protein [Deltaproteobacteria bacterium]MBW1848935.1 enoyl-CoA hydratase/isomerase family protein [Deltaproteobacteria bacterium]